MPKDRRSRWFQGARVAFVSSALVASALCLPGSARAQEQPFEDTALVDEYREDIPTATGPKGTGQGSAGGSGGGSGSVQPPPLQPALASDLREAVGAEDAKRLEEVATSPRYGAPTTPFHPPDEGGVPLESDGPGALSAGVTAFAGESGASLLPLVLALVFATGALSGAAVMRRRGRGLTP